MTAENAHVRTERARLQEQWSIGMDEGYDANPNVLPPFYFKPYSMLIARERGWIIGRELKLWELSIEKENK